MPKIDIEKLMIIGNEIENIAENSNINIIDACVEYATVNDIELETLGDIIKRNPSLKDKIQKDGIKLNFLKESDFVNE